MPATRGSAASGTTTTCERFADRMQARIEGSPRASGPWSWRAASSGPASWRAATPTWSAAPSTAAPPSCTRSWCSGPSPVWDAPRPASPASTSARPRPTPAGGARRPGHERRAGRGRALPARAAAPAQPPRPRPPLTRRLWRREQRDPATLAAKATPTRRLWRTVVGQREHRGAVMIDHDRDGATRCPRSAPAPRAPSDLTDRSRPPESRRCAKRAGGSTGSSPKGCRVGVVFVARRAGSGWVIVVLAGVGCPPFGRFPRGYRFRPSEEQS